MADGADFAVQDEPPAPRKRKKPRRADRASEIVSLFKVWRSSDGNGYATIVKDGRPEHLRIGSPGWDRRVGALSYDIFGTPLSPQGLALITNLAEAMAFSSGDRRRVWQRVALHNGEIWINLGDGRAVRITASGWEIVEAFEQPVFLLAADAATLPAPEADVAKPGDVARFLNISPDSDEVRLIWAWILCSLRPFEEGGSYVHLTVAGEQGSGKTFLARVVQGIIDPSDASGRALPREERELFISALHRHVQSYDNLSGLSDVFSDAFCRILTGATYLARAIYTNSEETIFRALRPVLLTGIPSTIAGRPDFADRGFVIELPPLASRRAERELRADVERARPGLLGLVCDGLSAGLRNIDKTFVPDPPRMVDAATWAEACAPGIGYQPGEITAAWRRNRAMADRTSLGADEVAQAVLRLVAAIEKNEIFQPRLDDGSDDPDELILPQGRNSGVLWKGTPSRLCERLSTLVSDRTVHSQFWPKKAAVLTNRLRRIAPGLRATEGIDVANGKGGGESHRWWAIRRVG